MSIVVNTPSGRTGRALTELLLSEKKKVTLITRYPAKVAGFIKRGARLVEGNLDDEKALNEALKGASALFWVTPPVSSARWADWNREIAQGAAEGVKANEVKHVVVLSSVGAQSGKGTGPVSVLPDVESIFLKACANVVCLRAGFFMENILAKVEDMNKQGTLCLPLPANYRFPMVAVCDVAQIAKRYLTETSWSGHRIVGVHGPRDLDWKEVTEIVGRVLGRKLQYVEVTPEQARNTMRLAGTPEYVADAYLELYQGARNGKLNPAEKRTQETTTSTTLETFAREVVRPMSEGLLAESEH